MPTLIYLIGFMGSGKSTMGYILANVLGFDFVDLDAVLEERFGRPISEYFSEFGEEVFRRAEHELLSETASMEHTVVATGGGAFLVKENRDLMLGRGLTVYLRLSVRQLAARLRTSRNRPLLYDHHGRTLTGEALRRRIKALLDERRSYYEMAHLIVDVDARPIGQMVDGVMAEIQASVKKPG